MQYIDMIAFSKAFEGVNDDIALKAAKYSMETYLNNTIS